MVGDDHQVANLEGGIHATCGIRYKEGLDAQFVHDANRERDFLHRVALVIVEAALHGHNVYAAQFAEDELARVSFDGRYRKVWNIAVRKL